MVFIEDAQKSDQDDPTARVTTTMIVSTVQYNLSATKFSSIIKRLKNVLATRYTGALLPYILCAHLLQEGKLQCDPKTNPMLATLDPYVVDFSCPCILSDLWHLGI